MLAGQAQPATSRRQMPGPAPAPWRTSEKHWCLAISLGGQGQEEGHPPSLLEESVDSARDAAPRILPLSPQVWMTLTSTGEVSPWLTSTAMAKWTLSMATGMAPTASICR